MSTTTTTPHLGLTRHFTSPDTPVYATVQWSLRDAVIEKDGGGYAFEQREVEFPASWSDTAVRIVASKYFHGTLGTRERESSVKQMLDRVVDTITFWGMEDGYFCDDEAEAFTDELRYLLLHQHGSFNSPVFFNIGVKNTPQVASACYILSIADDMSSIMEWIRQEAMIFKGGSGAGCNISSLRGSGELLRGGGTASGPLSFMKAADASAGVIKSGGKKRRAAKMIVMDVGHPDIQEFIWCKKLEEDKARALITAGYSADIDGEAYATVSYQNANNSVRVPDEFMRRASGAVTPDTWATHWRTDHDHVEDIFRAGDLLSQIADATWHCGDPGMQFDDTINAWHTVPNSGRINASNPCSEFMFLDDSACNLASINLLKFLRPDGSFDTVAYRHACRILLTAQEILVSRASYPTEAIARNSEDFRPLGLGYANLGALLMASGLPYDSERGRAYAAAVTALMTGEAYAQSARLASIKGPFNGFDANREPMLAVMEKHASYVPKILSSVYDPQTQDRVIGDVVAAASEAWSDAITLGNAYGYRNAQATLLAPTGTISFMMDCDTTGVEPDTALVKYKKLVGGGTLKIVNHVAARALETLGYNGQVEANLGDIIAFGVPLHIRDEHKAVFDCAFPDEKDGRAIAWEAHIRMVAAVQPFLSGSVSKTINMPAHSTVEDIERAYMLAWQLGLKSVAIYRDGCKATQPLTVHQETPVPMGNNGTMSEQQMLDALKGAAEYFPHVVHEFLADFVTMHERTGRLALGTITLSASQPQRKRLPDERPAITHKFNIQGSEGYLTVGLYPETQQPGELFIVMAKEGSTISGLMDAFATSISIGLQYGVPLKAMVDKFTGMRFEPAGFTSNKDIPLCQSLMDYIFRWLGVKFQTHAPEKRYEVSAPDTVSTDREAVGDGSIPSRTVSAPRASSNGIVALHAPICAECGQLMTVRTGTCFVCDNCGTSAGCS